MALDEFADHFWSTYPDLQGQHVVVALSGGADSVALLHLLVGLGDSLELDAAHVHHGIRGAEADDDAVFCGRLCRQLELPFHVLHIDQPAAAPAGREATWRRLRYEALLALAHDLGAAAVATAHHRDDVAEGVVVQLLRGGGPRALSGIARRTALGVIRPLLPWSRSELRSWLENQSIDWREDSSNRSFDHLRNRVRHELMPVMEEVSPALREHLVELAGALSITEAYLTEELRRQAKWIDPWEPDGGVEVALIRNLQPALRGRWLHAQAGLVGLDRVSRRQLQLFEQLLDTGSPRAVTLGGRWVIRSARGLLWLEPPESVTTYAFSLVLGEEVELPMPGWRVRFSKSKSGDSRWSLPVRPGATIHMRTFRSGDRLETIDGTASAARRLAESLPKHLRRTWPVFCEDDRICWIPGVWKRPGGLPQGGHVVEVMRRERPASGL